MMKSSETEREDSKIILLANGVSDDGDTYLKIPKFYTINLHLLEGMMMKATEIDLQLPAGTCISGIEGWCNGLLCLSSSSKTDLFLSNPTTRKHWQLPSPLPKKKTESIISPSQEICVYGFGYDGTGDDYKVIRVTEDYLNQGIGVLKPISQEVQVYSQKSNSWKHLPQFPYFIGNRRWPNPGKLVNHALHWVMEDSDDDVIAAFDLRTEQYHTVPLPPEIVERKESANPSSKSPSWPWILEVLEGFLCVMKRQDSTTLNLWIMEEYGVKDSWTEFVFQKFPSVVCPNPVPISISNSRRRKGEIFFHDNRYVFSYDAESQMLRKVVFFPSYIASSGYPLISSSLVQPGPSC
ncbi:OLC1v1029904C1 [Oldenlandia corymbosa var. corymbosa]|uniref:OLC1v1029904C1 n=1 Tax=Oldenlandia corymbosa var. corymbosa TaxID=529605 RepID=A0AAV1CFM2_OLDCO|nr:OLC1v1029904C1 [Oldenlandia corymbosa var. corymbosa]